MVVVKLEDAKRAASPLHQATMSEFAVISIRSISARDTLDIRHKVLWPSKPLSYVQIPQDEEGQHFGAFLHGEPGPCAVISVFVEPLPSHPEEVALRFRKFACLPTYRNRGIGSALFDYVAQTVMQDTKSSILWCDAREDTLPWYEKRGMKRIGDVFYKGEIRYFSAMKHIYK